MAQPLNKDTQPQPNNTGDTPTTPPAQAKEPVKTDGILHLWHQVRPLLVLVLVMFAIRSSLADWNDVPTGSMKPTILEGDRIFVNKLAYDLKLPLYGNEWWLVAGFAVYAVLLLGGWAWLKWGRTPKSTIRHSFFFVVGVIALAYFAHWAVLPDKPIWRVISWGAPQQGEIVVFLSPDNGIRLVKRCVAGPGDTVELRNNELLVNGVAATYAPLDPKYRAQMDIAERASYAYGEETMPGGRKHPMLVMPGKYNDRRTYGPMTLGKDQFFMMGDNRDNSGDSRFFQKPVTRDLILGRANAVAFSLDYAHSWVPRWNRFFSKMP